MENRDMDDLVIEELLRDIPPMELVSLVESLFSHDCLKDPAVKESVLQFEEQEEEMRVEDYSDEEVFSKYMEFRDLSGDPLNLAEYMAERREWEYEMQGEMETTSTWWEDLEKEKTEHALRLLEEYENRYKTEK